MATALIRRLPAVVVLWSLAALVAPAAFAQAEQRALVSAAALTFSGFLADRDMGALKRDLGQAKAVMIAPEIAKASFIVGGAGGRAVVVARDSRSGKWVGPAFYTLATASVGVQAGVSVSEVVTVVMTDKALGKLLSDHFSLGGDVGIAAGPVGANSRTYLLADFISYSRSQGVYVGVNLDGSVVTTSDDWNQLYYGRPARAPDILVRQQVQNRHANELLNLVAGAAK
ncbi:MAG TPA: lipid-binding SYLF domain-containing protein [Casimicrobiaceae bacterium]|nr:lipid-binding SYLF domain-containing protein [Casimicrobiaceae bacterium]